MEKKDFVLGAAIGAIIGAGAGILFAPKSGKETREDIKKHYDEMKDKIVTELKQAGEFTREKYNEVVGKVVGGYEAAKKVTPEEAKQIRQDLEEGFKRIEKAVKEASEAEAKARK